MLKFSEINFAEDNPQNAPEKNIQNEPLFTLIEDLLNMQKIVANETALVSEMPILIDKKKYYYSTKARRNTGIIVT